MWSRSLWFPLVWLVGTQAGASEAPPEQPGSAEAPVTEPAEVPAVEPGDAPEALDELEPDEPAEELAQPTPAPLRETVTWTGARAQHQRFRPMLRGGRYTSYASWGFLVAGAAMIPVGVSLGTYNFRGDWADKWRYDQAYLARSEAQTPVIVAGAVTAGLHFPLLMTGVLLEGRTLRKFTPHHTALGWVGLGMFVGGGAMFTVGVFTGAPPFFIMGGAGLAAGWACSISQFAFNIRTARHLPDAAYDDLYRSRRVLVSLAPSWQDGPGLAVFGRF